VIGTRIQCRDAARCALTAVRRAKFQTILRAVSYPGIDWSGVPKAQEASPVVTNRPPLPTSSLNSEVFWSIRGFPKQAEGFIVLWDHSPD
jgi:hypothetical protein